MEWKRHGAEIRGESAGPRSIYKGFIELPIDLNPNFEITVEFTTHNEKSDVGISIPLGGGLMTTCWICRRNDYCGIAHVDGLDPIQQPASQGNSSPMAVETGKRHVAKAMVKRDEGQVEIVFMIDSKQAGAYRGPVSRLKRSTAWVVGPRLDHIHLGADDSTVFHRAVVNGVTSASK